MWSRWIGSFDSLRRASCSEIMLNEWVGKQRPTRRLGFSTLPPPRGTLKSRAMRSFLLFVLVFGLLPVVFRHPVVGTYLWAWLSLMNPHKLSFGLAHGFNFALAVAIATL